MSKDLLKLKEEEKELLMRLMNNQVQYFIIQCKNSIEILVLQLSENILR